MVLTATLRTASLFTDFFAEDDFMQILTSSCFSWVKVKMHRLASVIWMFVTIVKEMCGDVFFHFNENHLFFVCRSSDKKDKKDKKKEKKLK